MYVSQVDVVPKTNNGLIHGPRNRLSGRHEWVETFKYDVYFGKRSISDCNEPFYLSPVGTERVVLRHVLLSNKGKIFPYTFQPLILILIPSFNC